MASRKAITPQWREWNRACEVIRKQIDKLKSIDYPVQGERWRDNSIASNERRLMELEAVEPSKYGD